MPVDGLKDKVPPHNDEAERATLGALLLDPHSLDSVLRYLRPEDFYKRSNGTIFKAIVELANSGEPVDLITLTDKLRHTGELVACGDVGYISALTSSVPSSTNIEYYARIVHGTSIRRTLIHVSHNMISIAHDDTKDARVIIEEAERTIFEIADKQQTRSYKRVSDLIGKTVDAVETVYRNRDSYTGVPSGYRDLDSMTNGFQQSEFIVIGARPSVGKTAFALSVAANMSIARNIPVAFFTLEMSDQALMQRILSSEARIRADALRSGMLKSSDFNSVAEAAARIYEAPLYIDDTPNMRLLDLRAKSRRLKARESVEAIFIDYIGLIELERRGSVPRHEQVAEISRSLKALARELEIPIICLSQVGRQTEGKAPTLADLRESGSIEQDADVVLFLHREREDKAPRVDTKLIVAKQRNGPTGMLELAFLAPYTRFEPLDKRATETG